MMKRVLLTLALIASLGAPIAASALTVGDLKTQLNDLLEQVRVLQIKIADLVSQQATSTTTVTIPPSSNARICTVLYRNLSQGAQGADVSGLQEFLHDGGYLSVGATGYYGALTLQAVAKWQTSEGVSALGIFGPLSRERVKVWCGQQVGVGNTTTLCTTEYAPVCGKSRCATSCLEGTTCEALCPLQTYANRCKLDSAQATFVHTGSCTVSEQPPAPAPTGPTVCTTEYAPVCGKTGCATSCPLGETCEAICPPQTFSNRCKLNAARATFLYEGACTAQ
ncbi:MAG TPA: peptidoglycan-binding domain-containing protein [Candidatus Paceibacterota bacterium]